MKRSEVLLLLFFVAVFILIYSYRILQFPIFEDEAELLFFSEKIIESPLENLFISMRYGPLPALSWLVALVSVFTKDTLLGGRLLNIGLAATLIFWNFLIGKFYNLPRRFFVFSSLLVMFSPVLILNSRVAIWDTSVLVFSAWYIYFFLLALKKPRPLVLLSLFIVLLVSFLIKFTSFFALTGLIVLLIVKLVEKFNRKVPHQILQVILVSVLCLLLFIYSFNVPVLGDAGTSLITNIAPVGILTKIRNNVWLYINWFKLYYPVYPLYLISFVYVFIKSRKEKAFELIMVLFLWFITSSFMMVAFNRFFYPRHILILVLPLMAITAYALLKAPLVFSSFLMMLVIALRIFLVRDIIVNYLNADIAKEDRFQYFEDYTSGINVNEISEYVINLSKTKRIVVWLDGTWVMEYGLRRGLKGNDNILIRSFSTENITKDTFGVNYVVVNKREPPNIKLLSLVKEFSWQGHKRQYLYQMP